MRNPAPWSPERHAVVERARQLVLELHRPRRSAVGRTEQAAITAGNIGRGLSETDIGLALQSALSYFEDRAYTGSRIIMLVSDGGDHVEPDAQARIRELARRYRVALYWIYIRSSNSPGLNAGGAASPAAVDSVPEYPLHRFFQTLARQVVNEGAFVRVRPHQTRDGGKQQQA